MQPSNQPPQNQPQQQPYQQPNPQPAPQPQQYQQAVSQPYQQQAYAQQPYQQQNSPYPSRPVQAQPQQYGQQPYQQQAYRTSQQMNPIQPATMQQQAAYPTVPQQVANNPAKRAHHLPHIDTKFIKHEAALGAKRVGIDALAAVGVMLLMGSIGWLSWQWIGTFGVRYDDMRTQYTEFNDASSALKKQFYSTTTLAPRIGYSQSSTSTEEDYFNKLDTTTENYKKVAERAKDLEKALANLQDQKGYKEGDLKEDFEKLSEKTKDLLRYANQLSEGGQKLFNRNIQETCRNKQFSVRDFNAQLAQSCLSLLNDIDDSIPLDSHKKLLERYKNALQEQIKIVQALSGKSPSEQSSFFRGFESKYGEGRFFYPKETALATAIYDERTDIIKQFNDVDSIVSSKYYEKLKAEGENPLEG